MMDLSSQKQTNLNRLIFFQEEILWKGFWAPVSCLWQSCGELPVRSPGGRLNKKDGLTRYGDSHVKDKTS